MGWLFIGKGVEYGVNDLQTLRPDLVPYLVGGIQLAQTLAIRSNKKVSWICALKHVFETTADKVTSRGQWCPYCAGKKTLAGFNDLGTTRPEIALQLVGLISPTEVTEWSHKYGLWECEVCGHVWESKVANRSLGRGCPRCSRKNTSGGEGLLRTMLSKNFQTNSDHLHRVSVPWRTRSTIQVDIFIESHGVIVEYDGAFWHSSDASKVKDFEKTRLLLDHGYRVLRVREFASRYPYHKVPIEDNNLYQVPYEYLDSGRHHLEDIVTELEDWILDV